jgi:molecular chaperone GrpE
MANKPPDNAEPKNGAPGAASAAHGAAAAGEPGQGQGHGQSHGHAGAARNEAPTHVDDIIAGMRVEAADLKDRLLRAHAEVENIRKRSEREKEETAKYAITRLARDIVGVGDNFQRAIDAVPPDAVEQDSALKSFLEGVTLTERELLNVLERYGIRKMTPTGEPFNPHLHQAVMEMQRTDVPAGTVVQVFQAGYVIEDRVLRPAMVAVAKGGPKAAPAAEGQSGAPDARDNPGAGKS